MSTLTASRTTTISVVTFLAFVCFGRSVNADCSGGKEVSQKCGKITFQGCCEEGVLYFCEGGYLCKFDCELIPECGWNPDKGFYDCGTDGSSDPAGIYPIFCPRDPCSGVTFKGCCQGQVVVWCSNKAIHYLDCSSNPSKKWCGTDETTGLMDCVDSHETTAISCNAIVEADITIPAEIVEERDIVVASEFTIPTDVTFPDLKAPENCSSIEGTWEKVGGNCSFMADIFAARQKGCVALWFNLVPEATSSPAGQVTLAGTSFQFILEGKSYACVAQLSDNSLQGQCSWSSGTCNFKFHRRQEPQNSDESKPVSRGKTSGCVVAVSNCTAASTLLLALVLLGVLVVLRGIVVGSISSS